MIKPTNQLRRFAIATVIFGVLAIPVFGQNYRIRRILRESKADLVFVGKIDSVARSYNSDGSGDDTEAVFVIQKILKGKYGRKNLSFRLSGHWGFPEGKTIVFTTRDSSRNHESMGCSEEPCHYYSSKWELKWSRTMEAKVRKDLRSKR